MMSRTGRSQLASLSWPVWPVDVVHNIIGVPADIRHALAVLDIIAAWEWNSVGQYITRCCSMDSSASGKIIAVTEPVSAVSREHSAEMVVQVGGNIGLQVLPAVKRRSSVILPRVLRSTPRSCPKPSRDGLGLKCRVKCGSVCWNRARRRCKPSRVGRQRGAIIATLSPCSLSAGRPDRSSMSTTWPPRCSEAAASSSQRLSRRTRPTPTHSSVWTASSQNLHFFFGNVWWKLAYLLAESLTARTRAGHVAGLALPPQPRRGDRTGPRPVCGALLHQPHWAGLWRPLHSLRPRLQGSQCPAGQSLLPKPSPAYCFLD